MSEDIPVQPKLADLLAGFLQGKSHAQANGFAPLELDGEVVPFEAGPVQPIDAKLAWDETLFVASQLGMGATQSWQLPPHWSSLVAAHEPVVALACALGNFPQMVRHFHSILQSQDLGKLRPGSRSPARSGLAAVELVEWAGKVSASKQHPQMLLAIGTLRLGKHFEEAHRIVELHDAGIPVKMRTAWENEKAALAWHRGEAERANDLWQRQPANAVTLFNRGMAALFLGRSNEASTALTEAVALLPDTGAWHHLGRLYLTLAGS